LYLLPQSLLVGQSSGLTAYAGFVSGGDEFTIQVGQATGEPASSLHIERTTYGAMPSLPFEVWAFSNEHRLDEYLAVAMQTARACFPGLLDLKFSKELDPEDNDEWIEMTVIVSDEENFLPQYREYNKQFVKQTPWPERTKIRLNFEFA